MLCGAILLLLLGFSWSLSDITIPAGSSLTLPCLSDLPSDLLFPKYTWTFTPEQERVGRALTHDPWWDVPDAELTLHVVGQQHAGEYMCVMEAQSGEGLVKMKRSFILHIQEIPLLMKKLHVMGTEGDSIILPCHPVLTSGNVSSASFSWYRMTEGSDHQELHPVFKSQSSSNKQDIATNRIYWASDPRKQDWSINIDKVELDDAGLYACEVYMDSEKKTMTLQLIVNPLPPPLCLNHSQPWEACPEPDNRSWKATVSEALIAFSVNIYAKLKRTHATSNLLFSPASIGGALSYLLLGARGQTRTELESALSLPSEFSCIHLMMKKMKDETRGSMLMAYQMFYNPKQELRESFVNQSVEFYDTVPEKLTNSSERNVKMVNDWVASKTQNKITMLMESVEPDTQLIILNTVYFIGKWKSSFDLKHKHGDFTTLSGERVSVPILYSTNFELAISYMPSLKAQVARFHLADKSSLYILVPTLVSEEAFYRLEDNMNEKNIKAMVMEMEAVPPVASEVTLPKIKLTLNTDLISLLKSMGLFGLFDDPNLCGMFPDQETTLLMDARHRAFLSLTEKGVEAAAVTSMSFSRSFSTFSAMKPFVFIVWSEHSKCPLFMGRVLNPKQEK
ncbi:plasma protease C1 inhibitor [Electrophorus electricus]|uniref:Ig-like domain-containing protein n=1 Tax=Electrophorus electricus TaxID=8005 RepID=A0A4W4EPJ0_ELEEL|nr:plasma protease C1 inhibitor [Electrophorus electricus]XP_026881680.2 plasma protease C1 inhibitor [Electrophorus electricus]